jgi:hypothetical protein
MKKFALTLILAALAIPASAISTDDGFRIGPRYSNYSTDADIGLVTIESGRQHSFGLVGDYRAGVFVLDFMFDHDPENGFDVSDLLPLEFGDYSRDRGEFTVGWAAAPIIDLHAGFRIDTFSFGGAALGGDFFDNEDVEHSAILAGVRVQTPAGQPFRVYGLFRGYAGTADFGGRGAGSQEDSTGWRAEGGVEIPIGDSNWRAVPGIEFERIDASPRLEIETNRFFVNFLYRFR